MNGEYLYHCGGCDKPDKNYPDEEIECPECKGSGYSWEEEDEDGERRDCGFCGGECYYTPRVNPIEHHEWARNDAYGIYTGLYCHKCYDDPTKYTYRKDRYHDESYCGEKLESEDY